MTKERILQRAEFLFFSKGFKSVSLGQICGSVEIKPASLYHYFPGGKEEIYLEVIRLKTEAFRASVLEISSRHDSLEKILLEFGSWYIGQSPMNMMLIAEMDMPYLSADGQRRVSQAVGQSVFEPVRELFRRFAGQLRPEFDPSYLVGTLSVLLFSAHTAVKKSRMSPEALMESHIRLFLYGIAAQT